MSNVRNLIKRIQQTVVKYKLLGGGDMVMVALSGGKDSLILLESLAACRKALPEKFDLIAVHVAMEEIGYKIDTGFLESFCNCFSVPLVIRNIKIPEEKSIEKGICFECSWHRRKTIFNLTREYGCNKLAFGHHLDDALETLLLNMVYHGSISSLPFTLRMFNGRVQIIRPLLELTQNELETYATYRNYSCQVQICPHENSKRTEMGFIIEKLTRQNRHARKNMFRSMGNIFPEYLPNYRK